jgi:hypothetical protein
VKEATELVYGEGSYQPGFQVATYVYGIAGEGLLNFGWLAVPITFSALGLLVGAVRRRLHTLDRDDARWLLFPLFPLLCMNLFTLDFDNVMVFFFQGGALPFFVIFLASKRVKRSLAAPAAPAEPA